MTIGRNIYKCLGQSKIWTSVLFAGVGFAAAYEAQGFYGDGAKFPIALGLIVGGLGLWNVITSTVINREHSVEAKSEGGEPLNRRSLLVVLAIFAFILGVVYLLGLAVGGGIGVGTYFFAMERFKILRSAIIGGLLGAAVWFVFDELANLSVYHGLLFSQ